jgi:hypothetical protein
MEKIGFPRTNRTDNYAATEELSWGFFSAAKVR